MSLTSCIEKIHASEGYITSFYRKFFVSQYGKTSWGNPSVLCFRKFPVAKFMDKRGGGYQDFPSKIFCLTVLKNFVEEPLCVSQIFWYRKNLWIGGWGEGGSITTSCQRIFCLTVFEKSPTGTLLCFTKFLVTKKFMDKREGGGREYHDFLSKSFLSHSFEKFRRGTLLCLRNFLVSKKFRDKRGGGHHDFPLKKCFVSQYRIIL